MRVVEEYTVSTVLRTGGMFTVAFSVVIGMLVVFVLPVACSIFGGLELLFLGILNLLGIVAFITGLVLSKKQSAK